MYKHILIATDGSDHALKAAAHGLGLAKSVAAKATALIVTPTWRAIGLSEIATGHFEDEYEERSRAYGTQCLGKITQLAATRAVPCDTVQVIHERPYEAIIDTAKARGCDLIVVGAHGRRGVDSVVLGSEATKVLTFSSIPVLVYRE